MSDLQEILSVIFAQKNAVQVIIWIGNHVNKPEHFQSKTACIISTKSMKHCEILFTVQHALNTFNNLELYVFALLPFNSVIQKLLPNILQKFLDRHI